MKKPEQRRLVLADRLLLELLRERKLELALVPDIAREQWPADMRVIGVEWDGGRIVATLEAEAWPIAGDCLELLYRKPVTRPPAPKPEVVTDRCPVCKTDRWVQAEYVIPRSEPGMRVCVDCGCVFTALPAWKREYLLDVVANRKADEVKGG